MNSLDLIGILYEKISTDGEIDEKNYERIVGKANKELKEKVIEPLYEKDTKKASKTESIISAVLDRESRYYFELGFKCAMQLRNIGEEQMHHE